MQNAARAAATARARGVVAAPIRNGPRTRRNRPCPCGSGRKFKRCHHPVALEIQEQQREPQRLAA